MRELEAMKMTIEAILKKHVRSATLLSSEPVKEGLLQDLREQKRLNSRLYSVLFGGVCVMGIIAIASLLTDVVKGQTLRMAILATDGIGVPVALEWIRRVVREWSQLNLLITLVGHSDEGTIQDLIHKLLSSAAIGFGSARQDGNVPAPEARQPRTP
jgi:hypothetical protein